MTGNPQAEWTPRRRVELVLRVLRKELSAKEAARQHGLEVKELESWQERFLQGAEQALDDRQSSEENKSERIRQLERKLGQMALDMDILRKRLNR